jgi:hypothetical protein
MKQHQNNHVVRCPLCAKGRIVDATRKTDISKLRLYGPRDTSEALLIVKCPKCGEQIGIALALSN